MRERKPNETKESKPGISDDRAISEKVKDRVFFAKTKHTFFNLITRQGECMAQAAVCRESI